MNVAHTPAAALAALAAVGGQFISAGGQLVRSAPRVHATERIAEFLHPFPAPEGGLPQCFGPIQYRPRKTQGVFLRRLPDLLR